jgi:hypothetical protein
MIETEHGIETDDIPNLDNAELQVLCSVEPHSSEKKVLSPLSR